MMRKYFYLVPFALVLGLMLFAARPARTTAAKVLVLCDGKTYDGYIKTPFQLRSPVHRDPNVKKIIRNCIFRNSKKPPIAIWDAQNVLIEGNTFENIRRGVAGKGVHAINISCRGNCSIDRIVIRNNLFRYIGADGIQIGEVGRAIRHVRIVRNEFIGSEDVGENGVDIKGVDGPIVVARNKMHGFRPCQDNQDCSGSPGEAMVVHEGGQSGVASNVRIKNNDFYDSIFGLTISDASENILVVGNRFSDNQDIGMLVDQTFSLRILSNVFSNNPTQLQIQDTPLPGGSCTLSGNTFIGNGEVVLKNSTCPNE
ncbi:MAG: hypothetical protein EYC68_21050 [Chloroflexota bacterium]|nr:MAG: hypothetical protein EYC68_21050 [Chloroflexota bacterium]